MVHFAQICGAMGFLAIISAMDPLLDPYFSKSGEVPLDSPVKETSMTDFGINKTASMSIPVSEISYSVTEEAQESISWFSYQIKKFFFESHFDVDGFDTHFDKLSKELADIDALVSSISPSNRKVKKMQVLYLQKVFERMKSFAVNFGTYGSILDSALHFLYRMAELSVTLHALCDSYGNIDISVHRYREKLFSMWEFSASLMDQFSKLPGKSEIIKSAFREYREFVEDEIELLWSQFAIK